MFYEFKDFVAVKKLFEFFYLIALKSLTSHYFYGELDDMEIRITNKEYYKYDPEN